MLFADVDEVITGFTAAGYLLNRRASMAVFLAVRLGKPLLVEGPAGVGKTELARVLARTTGARFLRLQCYEGLDEAKALYEWDYQRQLLYLQAMVREETGWEELKSRLYTEEFLLARPLLQALTASTPVTLLIDEVDKADMEFESFLLEALSDFQVSIPELGCVRARTRPYVVLTSNATRELSDALKRRCLYLYLDYPDRETELQILRLHVPGLDENLARQAVRFVYALRRQELQKAPSIAETIDWARSLQLLSVKELHPEVVQETISTLLKNQEDVAVVEKKLAVLVG